MIDLQQVQTELSCARAARIAVETVGDEIDALVLDMQNHAWQRVALIDEAYDPHLFQRPN
jgi:23S rRNA maturation-related 3'-5' exoribonuclease YhaM